MPVSTGRCFSRFITASKPPAEAPTPTTGKGNPSLGAGSGARSSVGAAAAALRTGFNVLMAAASWRAAKAELDCPERLPDERADERDFLDISMGALWQISQCVFGRCPATYTHDQAA